MCIAATGNSRTIEAPSSKQNDRPDSTIPRLMGEIIDQKRALLQEKIDQRFKGTNLLKEACYISSDLGTAGFSMVQAISLIRPMGSKIVLFGSISGLIGGCLDILQGLFLLTEVVVYLKNKQYQQGSRMVLEALFLIGIGTLMSLASLGMLGIKKGAMAGAAAIGANPFVMPILILFLAAPGVTQTYNHLIELARKKDLGSELEKEENPHLQELLALPHSDDCLDAAHEKISGMMEKFSDRIGVEAAIEAVELLKRIVEKQQEKEIQAQRDLTRKKIGEWNRIVALRAIQMTMYGLTFPLGVAAGCLTSSASKICNAVSKFSLSVPSSLGGYMDLFEPFKRNGAIAVKQIALPQK